jgi:C-terminal processing protease CtpA/Prc
LLADLIAGDKYDGKVFFNEIYSDKYVDWNSSVYFIKPANSIPLKRVFVMTTHETCSASELIINGLRPYIPVITIGEKTCGKPFLMNETGYKGYVYTPVTAHLTNAYGRADYENGIQPDCEVEENFNHQVGQKGDSLFDAVLYYQKNNACPG